MKNILINGVSAKIGGGKNILDNFILQLSQTKLQYKYYILTPDYENYKQYARENLAVIDIADFYKKNILFFLLYFIKFPSLLKKYKIDLIFNFGDIIIPTSKRQIYFFDWPYAVYSAKYIWNKMSCRDFFIRKIKVILIKKYICIPKLIIAQTNNIKIRLKKRFEINNIKIISTPVDINIFKGENNNKFNIPSTKRKYLFPATYSSHKNFEIIIPLAEKIKKQELPYTIVLTIDEIVAKKYIKYIKYKKLDSIVNVGQVPNMLMPSLYNQCDALIFPSLLETYGLPYIEAMACEKPILTSDLDFAHDICGEVAYYFNPFDSDSILTEMQRVFSDEEERIERIKKGKLKVQNLPDWETVVNQFQHEIDIVINS
jgi:glycosyltransferase involved in cell wall biosynthesis